ncbi:MULTISPECIES: 4-amino-4-deoxychorismate mutase CmlD [Streptomyces]|uniref:4-amino-4-deoxychorismate mutase n=2 Tax=Streptomyces venezuelae TaxID=54571 RepID=CMLD_STRVP|nr:4-amino-4-deoxychorismate mutase CmlD [Streptomyces venezuelae]F2RB77.1 RecName: Full=4-amino-4-deoxychorismate mutase; Short=ADC mutase [Streptomyces venezuelae ATCC 10712]APE20321.1 4-amino-4-deoxychorismate mutase [Streptomyces venezuelae]QER97723.1 chorismate mutase family protein [Streptomyces venezuelae ATCC 10712]QES04914.1 chorismate mutase family protein [Streptomyces venezuelae]QES16342.1 4-amino-4-deoxychorismate mutase [Streptomyces venezuelae]CCA54205.1 possible chorismate mut
MTEQNELQRLRAELDALDGTLLDTVRRRIDLGVRIARYKSRHGVPMMQPGRVSLVKDRAARYAADHGLDESFLVNLYDVIITEMCRVEDLVMSRESLTAEDRR